MSAWPRVIVHADMDAFYAAVEQRDDPTLRGRPILVGPRSGRGVVLTASYEARPFKVGSAMPMAVARRRCPEAVVVPPRFERYQEVSASVMRVFRDFSPRVEPLSLDEAFLDMSGSEHLFGPPATLGCKLKDAVMEATSGLTVSVGIAATKYVAKVASGYAKPDGLTIVPATDAEGWLAPQPVSVLWGAGPKLQQRLHALGLRTVGQVARADPAGLLASLGRVAAHLQSLARAEDPRPVDGNRSARSLSAERTFESDVAKPADIRFHLQEAAERVARRLRRQALAAQGVRIKLKRSDFRILVRQRRLAGPTQSAQRLFEAACVLLGEIDDAGPFRLIGLGTFDLAPPADNAQLDLMEQANARTSRLEAVLDALDDRFGPGTVQRARQAQRPVMEESVSLDLLRTDGAGDDSS